MRGKTQIKERIVKKKGTSTDGLGNSEPIQIVEEKNKATIKRFNLRKLCSEEKAKVVAGQFFTSVEEIKDVTRGSTQSSQQKPEIDVELSTICAGPS